MREKWTINSDLMFQNYRHFISWSDEGSQIAGLVFGRPARREVYVSDVEFVANVWVEGEDAPLIGDGFTLTTTKEILENADATTFLTQNDLLKHSSLTADGLSIRFQVGFSCALRRGVEGEDLKNGAEKFTARLEQLSFANVEKGLLLHKEMNTAEMQKQQKSFDELSRGALQYTDHTEVIAYRSLAFNAKDESEDQKMVPIVRVTRDGTSYTRTSTNLEITVPVVFGDSPSHLYSRLLEGVRRRVHVMVKVMLTCLNTRKQVLPTTSHVFLPPGWSTFLHVQTPLCDEVEQHSFRVKLHKLFNLPLTVPCLRSAQAVTFATSKLLRSPHLQISNYKARGVVSVVKGDYNYHHYMQDGLDDSGWGCAYRSLQTIWSWFVLNGFTEKPVPTHLDIQKCLVEIKDKEAKFLGSRQWIGSTEIGFVLDHLLGVESRFIITNSGAEVAERARELALHFQTVGTPVMIGGGQLAHTILGVDFDENTGECQFLVLDPHYTGSEDLKTILAKGWCGWKPATFWCPQSFYNIALPQTPKNAV